MANVMLLILLATTWADLADVISVTTISETVCLGESKTLRCRQPVNYNATIIRFQDPKTKKHTRLRKNIGKDGAVTINNIQERDAGLYRIYCNYRKRCWNGTGPLPCIIKLDIKKCEIKRATWSSSITMPCKTDRPNTDIKKITWQRITKKPKSTLVQVLAIDGNLTDQAMTMYSGRLQVVGTSLVITDTNGNDTGAYVCKMQFVERENDHRKPRSAYTVHLFIEGFPANGTCTATVLPLEPTQGFNTRHVSSSTAKCVRSTVLSSTTTTSLTNTTVLPLETTQGSTTTNVSSSTGKYVRSTVLSSTATTSLTNATVLPLEPTQGSTTTNVSSSTGQYVRSTVLSSTATTSPTVKEDNVTDISPKKGLGARVQATDCMYIISLVLFMLDQLLQAANA